MKHFTQGVLLAIGWCVGCDIYRKVYKEVNELINGKQYSDEEGPKRGYTELYKN